MTERMIECTWLPDPSEQDEDERASEPVARCGTCGKERPMWDMEEYYSFGLPAGRYCNDRCWKGSGYRDATDPDARFDPMDAGEVMEPEDY